MSIATHSRTESVLAPSPPNENAGASFVVASQQVAARTVKKFVRSPQLIVAGTAQGALFLLIFRYVFGGAIGHTGSLSYVDFVIPGFVVTSVLFTGMGASTGIAEDVQEGLFDRLRSLPISMASIISGRVAADTAMLTWSLSITTLFGVLVGFRVHDGAAAAWRRSDCACSMALPSAGSSSRWDSWPAVRRRPRASRSWSSP